MLQVISDQALEIVYGFVLPRQSSQAFHPLFELQNLSDFLKLLEVGHMLWLFAKIKHYSRDFVFEPRLVGSLELFDRTRGRSMRWSTEPIAHNPNEYARYGPIC